MDVAVIVLKQHVFHIDQGCDGSIFCGDDQIAINHLGRRLRGPPGECDSIPTCAPINHTVGATGSEGIAMMRPEHELDLVRLRGAFVAFIGIYNRHVHCTPALPPRQQIIQIELIGRDSIEVFERQRPFAVK